MANTLRIKRRATGGAAGAPSSLKNAELAFNENADNTKGVLYYGYGESGGNAASIIAIAGPGAYVSLAGTQTTATSLAISGDKDFTGTVTFGANTTGVTASTADNTTKLATTAYVKAQGYGVGSVTSVALSLPPAIFTVTGSPVTGNGTLTGTLASQTANFVWAAPDGSAGSPTFRLLVANDIPSLTASKISNFDTQVRTSRLDQMAAPTADVSHNNTKITNLADPVSAQDAATKAYVDAARSGLDVKQSVRAASTASVTVTYSATGGTSTRGQITAAPNTLDGVSLAANDRILLKNQSTGAQNGIWVVTTLGTGANGVWDRATDFDQDAEVTAGAFTFVEEGTTNADTGWVLSTNQPVVIGGASGTSLTFTQFSGAGSISAGAGLTQTGTTIDVASTGGGSLTISADSINLTSGIATAGTYRSVTVDTYGRTTAGTNPTTFSGYAISDTSANLAAAITDETGSGSLVFATSPTLVTPTLGVASATSVNKVTITAPATGSTLTIADGKTLTASNTLTFTGTDSSSVAFGTGGTVAYTAGKLSQFAATTSAELAGVISDETGSGALVFGTTPTLTTPALAGETFSTTNNVTAGTNAQGQGALTSDYNVITTAANNPSGVTLPTATTGRRILIVNKGANSVNVYPATSAAIDAGAANAAVPLPAGQVMEFNAASTTLWYSSYNLNTVAGSQGVQTFSAGTTGLTPSTATSGAITLSGTLNVANGGTGATTLTGVLKGNGTSAFTAAVDGTDYLSPNATIDCGTFLWIFGLTGLVLNAVLSAGSVIC